MSEERKPIVMGGKYRLMGFPKSRVIVFCTDGPHEKLPVVACYDKGDGDWFAMMYSSVGAVHSELAYLEGLYDLVEIGEWDDFRENEPVMVRDDESEKWKRRYFKKVDEFGQPCTYPIGLNGLPTRYKFCRRPTPDELAEGLES